MSEGKSNLIDVLERKLVPLANVVGRTNTCSRCATRSR